jgi:nucleotide-binding universal stress UspA family protein
MANNASIHAARQPEPSSPKSDEEGRQDVFTILVPLDGSERAAHALPIAEDIGQRLAGDIALIRILPVTALPYAIPADYIPPDIYQQMVDDQKRMAQEYLERVVAEIREHGLRARAHIQHGEPASAIIDAIPALRVSMVVMTTHGRTGLARFTLGSVADRVVRGSGVPILLVRSYPPEERPAELRSALVALDGSLLAESALFTIALLLAGPVLREITLARVVDPRNGSKEIEMAEEYLDLIRRRFITRLEKRECAVSTRVEVGSPAEGILAAAHARKSDLILMSTHGSAGIERLAFGSVTDRLLRDGDLPLLLVSPAKGAPERQR